MPKLENSDKSWDSRVSDYNDIPCCIEMREMKLSELKKYDVFSMEENLEKINLGGYSSNYKLFKLNNDDKEHFYRLTSYFLERRDKKSTYFAYIPKISVLDKNFKILRSTKLSHLHQINGPFISNTRIQLIFSYNKSINPDHEYLLIHTNDKGLGSSAKINGYSYTTMNFAVLGGQVLVYENTTNVVEKWPFISPSGVLVLEETQSH